LKFFFAEPLFYRHFCAEVPQHEPFYYTQINLKTQGKISFLFGFSCYFFAKNARFPRLFRLFAKISPVSEKTGVFSMFPAHKTLL